MRQLRGLHPDLPVAVAAAWTAQNRICAGWDELLTISEKEPGDLFTEVDREADALIQKVLRGRFPQDGVRSEELTPTEEARNGRLWIVDPLDASNGFVYHLGKFMPTTLIALEVDGVVVLAVVYFPLTSETFYAVKGKGAYCMGERITTSWAPTKLQGACVEMNHFPNSVDETEVFARLWQRLRSPQGASVVTNGAPYSGISARIAQGEPRVVAVVHDNNPSRKPKQCLWDVAAPALVLREAGGVVVNMRGEEYNPRKHEPFVCAANQAIADQILALAKA